MNAYNSEIIASLQTEGRLDWLDIAKGLAIIAVVCSHSQCSDLIWIVSACYVPVFFVCAGYTMRKKTNVNYMAFAKRKAHRLLLPYVFCMFCIILFNYLSGLVLHQPFDWFRSSVGVLYSRAMLFPTEVAPNMLMLPDKTQPMWFLTALWVSLLLAYPFLNIIRCKKKVGIIVLVMIIVAYLFTSCPILLPWSIDTLPLYILMILFGVLVREHGWMNFPWYVCIFLIVVYTVMLYVIGEVNFSVRSYGNSMFMATVTAIIGSLLMMKISQMVTKIHSLCKPLALLGRHSLYIMCFHLPVLVVCRYIIGALSVSTIYAYMLNLFSVALAIIIGFMFSILVQRYIPVLR